MSSSEQTSQQRTNRGRRRVHMGRMENESNLQVTFSKRRAGLFKKASEICTLTGAEGAVVVFSPTDKVYSFGHPDVQTITDRFNYYNPHPFYYAPSNPLLQQVSENGLNMEVNQIEDLLQMEKKKAEEIKQGFRALEMPKIGELDYEQLEQRKWAIQTFGNNVSSCAQNLTAQVVCDPIQGPYPEFPARAEPNIGFPPRAPGMPAGTELNFGVPLGASEFPGGTESNLGFSSGAFGFHTETEPNFNVPSVVSGFPTGMEANFDFTSVLPRTEPNFGFTSGASRFPTGTETNFSFPSGAPGADPNFSFPLAGLPSMSPPQASNAIVPFGQGTGGEEGEPSMSDDFNNVFGPFDGGFFG